MRKLFAMIVVGGFLAGTGARALQAKGAGTSLPDDVKRIFKSRCAVCHKGKYPPMGLNLEAGGLPAAVVGVPSGEQPELKIVDPGRPETSYLIRKIKGAEGITGKSMPPPPKDPLAAAEIERLAAWVASLSADAAPILSPAAGASPGPYDKPAFWGTRAVNLPTTTTMGKGDVLFLVAHRFVPAISAGADAFWGLDGPAMIYLRFGYGITDRLGLSVGRARLNQEWDLTLSWLIAEQGLSAGLPFSAAAHAGVDWASQKREGQDLFEGSNFKAHAALSVSHQFSRRFSILAVPAFATNTNHWDADAKTNFALGLAVRFMAFEDLSLLAEWVPLLSGYTYEGGENGWGLAVEKKIGGHVFQVFVNNAFGLTPSQVLAGGDLRLGEGDFRLGFNIFRTF